MDRKGCDLDESVLRRAFEGSLDILGQRLKESVIYDLENTGEYRKDEEFSLEKIALGLNRLFGKEAAEMMVERIILKMDELAVILKKQEN
jgi:hypothetical protein